MQRAAPRHFSMLRGFHLADFFTLGNAACGVGAVFFAMLYMAGQLPLHFYAAAALPTYPHAVARSVTGRARQNSRPSSRASVRKS